MRTWLSLIGLIALALLAHSAADRLPAPQGASAPDEAFSATRARTVLDGLTALGPRVAGTPQAAEGAERLASALRQIPGLEVLVVQASGVRQFTDTAWPYPIFDYRIINVMARLPGRSTDAVLLNAHFDTTGTSAGAGDDAFGVAAIVETMRALASGPPLERSVIALLNGGEEFGLRGADAFTRHAWARDVRAYFYIDGMARGRPRLLQATPGHPELVAAFLEGAPRPSASVVMQEIVEAQSFGSDGDHRPLDGAGLAGLAVACIDDMAAAHTRLDGSDRVQDGALQAMGDTTLGVTRVLASGEPAGRPAVYFDVYGWPVSASGGAAAGWTVGALVAVVAALRRQRIRPLIGGLLWTALSLGAGLSGALGLAAALGVGLGHAQGWYTWPALAVLGFGGAATAGLLGVQALWARRGPRVEASEGAVILGWALLLALAAINGVRAGYLAFAFAGPLALASEAGARWPHRAPLWRWLGAAPGVVLLVHLAVPALGAMLPMIASMPLPIPTDLPVSVLVSLPVLACLCAALPLLHGAGSLGRAAMASGALALGSAAIMSQRAPFDADHPRHVTATHTERDGVGVIALGAWDALPLEEDLAALSGVSPAKAGWRPNLPPLADPSYEVAAATPSLELPAAEVLSSGPLVGETREVALRLRWSTPHLVVLIPADRLAGWSLGPLPEVPAAGDHHEILMSGLAPDGAPLSLTLKGEGPVNVELRASSPLLNDTLQQLEASLPAHVVLWPEVTRSTALQL